MNGTFWGATPGAVIYLKAALCKCGKNWHFFFSMKVTGGDAVAILILGDFI